MFVVETPSIRGTMTTLPPHDRTASRPTTASSFQSPPLTRQIGPQVFDQGQRRRFIKQGHIVDRRQGGDHLGPLPLGNERPLFPLDRPDGGVAVEGQDEEIPRLARLPQILDMARVQDVETAVREGNLLRLAAGGVPPLSSMLPKSESSPSALSPAIKCARNIGAVPPMSPAYRDQDRPGQRQDGHRLRLRPHKRRAHSVKRAPRGSRHRPPGGSSGRRSVSGCFDRKCAPDVCRPVFLSQTDLRRREDLPPERS